MKSPEIDGFILPSLIAGQARHRVDLQVLTTLDRHQIVTVTIIAGERNLHVLRVDQPDRVTALGQGSGGKDQSTVDTELSAAAAVEHEACPAAPHSPQSPKVDHGNTVHTPVMNQRAVVAMAFRDCGELSIFRCLQCCILRNDQRDARARDPHSIGYAELPTRDDRDPAVFQRPFDCVSRIVVAEQDVFRCLTFHHAKLALLGDC